MNIIHLAATIVDTKTLPKPSTTNTLDKILNIVFSISASIALLMIVVSGLRYILARGDPNGTARAREGIIYSVIGLVITMAAYSIVTFVVRGLG